MHYHDPLLLASIVLGALAGFFVGRLLSTRFLGGCMVGLLGTGILALFLTYLFTGPIYAIQEMTHNLADYINYDYPAFLAIVVGFFLGALVRNRASATG